MFDRADPIRCYGITMSANLCDPRFGNADQARRWFEDQRWPHGVICPHCGNSDQMRIKPLQGKSHRPGLYNCIECRLHFTVTVGTAMHRSKIPLNKWLIAIYLISASGASARELHDTLGIAYQSAWYLSHRIRGAMSGQEIIGPHDSAADAERETKAIASRLLLGPLQTILVTHKIDADRSRYA